MRLEELRRGMLLEGVSPDGAVTLKDVESDGDGTAEVIFKDASGSCRAWWLTRASSGG